MQERDALQRSVVYGAESEQRRAEGPLFTWEPTAKQKPFIDSVLSSAVPETWMVAASRAGKSDSGAYCGSMLARFGTDAKSAYGETVTVFDRATPGRAVSLDFPSSRA